VREALARAREVTELGEHEAGEGLVVLLLGQLEAELLVDVGDAVRRIDLRAALGEASDRSGPLVLPLVVEVPDELREQIAEGHETAGASVLVEHDRHLQLLVPELREQLGDQLGLGHEVGGPHQLAQGALLDGFLRHALQDVAGGDDAHDAVEGALEDRDAAVAALGDRAHRRVEAAVHLHCVDLCARGHDLAHVHIVELHDVLDDLALVLVELLGELRVLDRPAQALQDAASGGGLFLDTQDAHHAAAHEAQPSNDRRGRPVQVAEHGQERPQERVAARPGEDRGQHLAGEEQERHADAEGEQHLPAGEPLVAREQVEHEQGEGEVEHQPVEAGGVGERLGAQELWLEPGPVRRGRHRAQHPRGHGANQRAAQDREEARSEQAAEAEDGENGRLERQFSGWGGRNQRGGEARKGMSWHDGEGIAAPLGVDRRG
jgi:hypothetical protein